MTFKLAAFALVLLLTLPACQGRKSAGARSETLAEARKGFKIQPTGARSGDPVEPPPPNSVRIISYPSAVGELAAYLSLEPRDGRRHPAIVWITGGDCNSIGKVWP